MMNRFVTVLRRHIHQVPRLAHQEKLLLEGVEGLFSAEGVNVGWKDYQRYLTTNLTLKTLGTDLENVSAYNIIRKTGSLLHQSPVFHFASQSHNNHLFYEQLIDKSSNKSKISQELLTRIEQDFESLDNFQSQILTEADLLNGQGWVFLIEKLDKKLEIISCHNDGSPYLYGRNQSSDLSGPILLNEYSNLVELQAKVEAQEPDYNLPLLLINCWEFAYLQDYGVNGRTDYLEKLWACINWDVVNNRLFNLNKLNELLQG